MKDKLALKQQVYKVCLDELNKSLTMLEKRLLSVQESRNNETKSSVGDKYETGRAMMQIEEENIRTQQAKVLANKQAIQNLQTDQINHFVQVGSIVITNHLNFYISIALGKIKVNDQYFYCISKASPIGQILQGKAQGENASFNGKNYEIINIY